MSKKEKTEKTEKTEVVSKNVLYNKKRKPILRVEASASDTSQDIKEMLQMKDALVQHSGSAKQGVIDMYRFALKEGFFE